LLALLGAHHILHVSRIRVKHDIGGVPHPTYFYPVTLLIVILHSNVEFKIIETQMRDLQGKVTELKPL
jgi:hypothetical protein